LKTECTLLKKDQTTLQSLFYPEPLLLARS
jgi:hypothetical protein